MKSDTGPGELLLGVISSSENSCRFRLLQSEDKPSLLSIDWSTWIDEEKDGVRWNDLADRPWEWWKHESDEEDEEEGRA